MRESWGTNLAPIRALATVADDEYTHFTLGCLDSTIGLAGWNGVAFREEQKVVDQSLHIFFHGGAGWRRNLVVFHAHRTRRHFVKALVDNAQRLSELFHAAQIPVITVAVHADRNIKFYLVVCIVRLGFADIPRYARPTQHDTAKRVVESLSGRHDSNILGSPLPDAVVGEEFFGLINTVTELRGPLIYII